MTKPTPDPFQPRISIATKINQEEIGDGLLATVLTGFVDVRQFLEVDGRRFLFNQVLPFSYTSIVEEIDCEDKNIY